MAECEVISTRLVGEDVQIMPLRAILPNDLLRIDTDPLVLADSPGMLGKHV